MANKKPNILIVGDSFIDENWLMSKFDVYHSYNVGKYHYISILDNTNYWIISLCGAAGIMRILNGSLTSENDEGANSKQKLVRDTYNLIAVSAWNPLDNFLLPCIFCQKKFDEKREIPYLLSGLKVPWINNKKKPICPYKKKPCDNQLKFYNLIKYGEISNSSSNRLIRVYEGFGSDQPRLQYRFDWRLEINDDVMDENIFNNIQGIEDTKAVIIVDHGYGAINPKLIEKLYEKCKQAMWYIRCKLESSEWMEWLFKKEITFRARLLFTDEQLVEYKYGARVWRHGSSTLGRGSLEVLGDLLGLEKFEHTKPVLEGKSRAENAAFLFDDDTVIAGARLPDSRVDDAKGDAKIVNIKTPPGEKQPIQVGRSSVFFSSLIYWDLMNINGGLTPDTLYNACYWALENSYEWTRQCTNAWLKKELAKLSGPFETPFHSDPNEYTPKENASIELPTYQISWKEWNDSSHGLGIITRDDEKQIQLWRAYGTLKDYICPGGEKRSKINELINRLSNYSTDENPKYPFNCLLLAQPGWGKSFLAQCLSRHFDFEYLSFSIAQMATNHDLVDSLKMIASTQNRTEKRLLIFIDEIDAEIENHKAMGLLLEPIWNGFFKTEGNIYRIEPCIWVFASTKPVTQLVNESKGKDFISRINGPIIELDFFSSRREELDQEMNEDKRLKIMIDAAREPVNEALKTEIVYHGVNFLNRLFGPISEIDEAVLDAFYKCIPINGIRSIEIFVSRFTNILRGRVSFDNIPKFDKYPELERHLLRLDEWPSKNYNREVKLTVNPSK